MTHDQDTDDALAGIELHLWRVPPPVAVDRPALLVRALAPAATSPKRSRLAWILAAMVILNAAIAILIGLLVARAPTPQTVTIVQAAGGGSVDAEVRALLQRLEREQRELERKLAEIQELRALVVELSERVRRYEQQDGRRDRAAKPPERLAAERIDAEPTLDRCDEVSCVLTNYKGACCTRFRPPGVPIPPDDPPTSTLPEALDRTSITRGIAAVKARVATCARRSAAKGVVKITVRVDSSGLVTSVVVKQSPDPALGACVAAQVQKAVFPETQVGGSFGYPFVF